MSDSLPPRRHARIVVATHGKLACALLNAVESIAGPQQDIVCLCLAAGDSPAMFEARLSAALTPGVPALVLVDFPGGTPWNVALRVAHSRQQARVVGGVNLPMLLEVVLLPSDDLEQLAGAAVDAGIRSIQLGPHPLPAQTKFVPGDQTA
ncbi:MAG: PTS sugar transporter subunit IIA [Candidatus Roseilinea sp.]|uniref:PTS sugar transporter subunit IIA n=1 Tax=Candidatus Roseilinea sp. TaxID=2838777 RepID=UPI00404B54DA